MATQHTVDCSEHQITNRINQGKGKQAIDSSLPVVEDVLDQLFIEEVSQEAAGNGEPDNKKVNDKVEHSHHFVLRCQAKAERELGKEKKKKVLKISFKKHGSQEYNRAICPQKFRDFIVEEDPEANIEGKEDEDNKDEVEGDELPGGR